MDRHFRPRRASSLCASLTLFFLLALRALADPLPGEDLLKFQQLPLTGGSAEAPTFPGHAETSTAYATFDPVTGDPTGWQGTFMADDFADLSSAPVVHVGWWGSYAGNFTGNGVQHFLITFESDVPGGGAGGAPSHPGTPLLSQVVNRGALAPNSGTFTERSVPSSSATTLYHYNAELNFGQSFSEQPDTVYWLKVVALIDPTVDGNISWGWQDRDWSVPDPLASVPPGVTPGEGVIGNLGAAGDVHHFQDDAVSGSITISTLLALQQSDFVAQRYLDGIDGPQGIEQFSKDLAFELFSKPVPEPDTASLLAFGVAIFGLPARAARGRRR